MRVGVEVLFRDHPCNCGRLVERGDTVFAVRVVEGTRGVTRHVCGDCVRPFIEEMRRIAMLPEPERREAVRAQRAADATVTIERVEVVVDGPGSGDPSRIAREVQKLLDERRQTI